MAPGFCPCCAPAPLGINATSPSDTESIAVVADRGRKKEYDIRRLSLPGLPRRTDDTHGDPYESEAYGSPGMAICAPKTDVVNAMGRAVRLAPSILWLVFVFLAAAVPAVAGPSDCPDGGIRFGVEPYEEASAVIPIFDKIGAELAQKMGCPVTVFVASSYNAEIEAMRADKLELGEFGPLAYVLAHQIANADAFATYNDARGKPSTYYASIVTWPGSGITSLAQVAGHSFAFSDPDSASGHLFPAYGLRKAGIDPSRDIRAEYAGSHVGSFEAILNQKVDAGELNSQQIAAATAAGIYKPENFITLWRSQSIPNDPIAIRGDLPGAFKKRLIAAFLSLNFAALSPDEHNHLMSKDATGYVAVPDAQYDVIRDLVKTLGIDLKSL
jgi:phosphonate transport system substrate-binding protein